MTWRLKLLSSLKLWMDQAIFFGIVSFFFNYVPEVGELPSCWWNVLPRFLHPVASCGEWKLAVGWGTIIAIIIPMPVILLDGRLASPATTWGASVQWRAFFYSLPNRGCMGLLQLWLQFVSHQCQWEQWMPQVVEGNDRTIGRGPSKTASHVTWAHLVIEQPTAWGPWTGPWWHF